jgi:hypothetical protein
MTAEAAINCTQKFCISWPPMTSEDGNTAIKKRTNSAKLAALLATLRKAVTGVGAPS